MKIEKLLDKLEINEVLEISLAKGNFLQLYLAKYNKDQVVKKSRLITPEQIKKSEFDLIEYELDILIAEIRKEADDTN